MVVKIFRNGDAFYLHTAWANDAAGSDFSLTEYEGALFIGNYTDRSSTESELPRKYMWKKNIFDDEEDTGEEGPTDLESRLEDLEAYASTSSDDLTGTQQSTDSAIGNPNLLIGTNEGVTNYSVTSGYSIEETVDSIGEDTDFINCVKITCNTPSTSGMLFFNADSLRAELGSSVDENTYTISMHTKMSTLFEIETVAVQNADGTSQQLVFELLSNDPENEGINMDDEWAFYESTTQCAAVEESSQMLCMSLANMAAGTTLVIANLKIEAGAIATPWRESIEEVSNKLKNLKLNVLEVERILAHKVTADEFAANNAIIDSLEAKTADLEDVDITNLKALIANLDTVSAKDAELINAEIDDLQAKVADIKDLSAEDLAAINADIDNLRANVANFDYVSADKLAALDGYIKRLETEKLSAEEAYLQYAKIDKTNIDTAWIEDLLVKGNFLANSVNSATGSFSKWLTGVRILGDLIEAETLRANTLIIRGTDGLYRRLNIDSLGQMTVDADEKYSQALDGSVLVKESVTAAEINVFDLFAQNILSTGDFNMGGKGALIYDAETDTLMIRARDITIGESPAVSKEELERLEIGSRNFVRNSKNLIFGDYHFGAEPIKKFKLKTPEITMKSDKLGRPIVWTIKKDDPELDRPNIYLETVNLGKLDAPSIYLSTGGGGASAVLGKAVLGSMILGRDGTAAVLSEAVLGEMVLGNE